MHTIARATGLVLAAGTLMSISPAPQQYSAELLTMLANLRFGHAVPVDVG